MNLVRSIATQKSTNVHEIPYEGSDNEIFILGALVNTLISKLNNGGNMATSSEFLNLLNKKITDESTTSHKVSDQLYLTKLRSAVNLLTNTIEPELANSIKPEIINILINSHHCTPVKIKFDLEQATGRDLKKLIHAKHPHIPVETMHLFITKTSGSVELEDEEKVKVHAPKWGDGLDLAVTRPV